MELHILSGFYYVKSSFIFSYFGAEKWGRGVSISSSYPSVLFLHKKKILTGSQRENIQLGSAFLLLWMMLWR